jgi:hypothetical protein
MYVKNLYLNMSLVAITDNPLENFVWREILNLHCQILCELFPFYVKHSNGNGVRL